MTAFPARGQKAPAYWDTQLKAYIDEGDTSPVPSTRISDFLEAVQDAVGGMVVAGTNVTLAYNDAAGTLTVTSATGADAEVVRDTIGAALVGINGVVVTVNDAADTITLSVAGLTISQVTGLQAALDAKEPLHTVQATVSASGALVVNRHNPVDASGAVRTMTLPTGQTAGTEVSAEKTDASTNLVSVTGNIRGVAAQTISLAWQNETVTFRADAAGSWWPVSGHKTKATLDTAYKPSLANALAGSRFDAPLDGTVSTNASLARPSARTDIFFTWNSTVQPTNMIAGDKWDKQVS